MMRKLILLSSNPSGYRELMLLRIGVVWGFFPCACVITRHCKTFVQNETLFSLPDAANPVIQSPVKFRSNVDSQRCCDPIQFLFCLIDL